MFSYNVIFREYRECYLSNNRESKSQDGSGTFFVPNTEAIRNENSNKHRVRVSSMRSVTRSRFFSRNEVLERNFNYHSRIRFKIFLCGGVVPRRLRMLRPLLPFFCLSSSAAPRISRRHSANSCGIFAARPRKRISRWSETRISDARRAADESSRDGKSGPALAARWARPSLSRRVSN